MDGESRTRAVESDNGDTAAVAGVGLSVGQARQALPGLGALLLENNR